MTLGVTLRETPKVTFESLSSDFELFGVSGVLEGQDFLKFRVRAKGVVLCERECFLTLSFLGCSVFTKENLQIYQRFPSPSERIETLEKQPRKDTHFSKKIPW